MLRTEKGRKRSVPPGLSPVPAAGPRLSRADMRPPRDRAAGTQHRRAGARSSFCPLPPWALGRDVALSPTRVQKDQVVAKVGSHCAACAGASWGWGGGCGGASHHGRLSAACARALRAGGLRRSRAEAVLGLACEKVCSPCHHPAPRPAPGRPTAWAWHQVRRQRRAPH